MPRLIVKGGKVGVLRGRVVTDAGGAPCCCEPSCRCDLTNTFVAFRAGCAGTPPQTVPVVLAGGAGFGTITLRVTWSGFYTFTQGGVTDTLEADGEAVLCAGGNTIAPVVLSGSSRSTRVRNGPNPLNLSAVYGADRWNAFITTPSVDPRRALSFIGPRLQTAAFGPGTGFFSGIPAFLPNPELQGYESPCNYDGCPGNGSPGCNRYVFTDSDTTGETHATGTYDSPVFGVGRATQDIVWTRDLSCRVGGSGILPPGIDPKTLRPYSSGPCVGCGD